MMKIIANGKSISVENKEILKTGNKNAYKMTIETSEDWEGFTLSVVFKIGFIKIRTEVVNGTIIIPEIKNKPDNQRIYVGLFGIKINEDGTKEERDSTNLDYLLVEEGAYDDYLALPPDEEPSLLDRYLKEMKEYFESSKQEFEDSVTEAKDDINTARTGALDDIVLEKNSAVSAINSAKTDALGELNDSKESAINEIEDLNSGLKTRVASLESGKVDKEAGKQLSDENYTLAEKNKLAGLENYDDTNIRASIQAILTDLVNYYRKTETYSKTEVDQMISVIPKFAIQVVDSLPATEISPTTIYLLRTGTESLNVFTEYIYINGSWEKLGTQKLDLSGYSTTEQMNAAISTAINTLEATMNAALAGKVDKIAGKGLSTEDYTTEEKTQLAANTTKITELTKKLDNYSDIFSLIERYCLMTRDGRVFGTHFEPFSVSHLSTGTRTKASIGKYMNPATNETPQDTNFPDFLTKPLFECNGHLDNDGEFHIDAIKGDEDFSDTGKNDVWLAYRTVYLKHTYDEEAGEDYEISDCLFDGASVIKAAIRRDGSISPVIFIAKYQAGNIDGILYSSKGLKPARNQSYNNNVTNYHKKGRYYSGMTDYEYMFFQFLFVILFADRNNETHLRGNTNNNYQYNVAYGEENVSRVVLTTTQAANIDILSCVSVGNMGTATNKDRGQTYIHNIIDDVRVIGKEVVDENHTALILDCNPVDIPENALVSTMHEVSGFSDYVLGDTGSPISCTNGKHGIVLAGCELLVGGYETIGNTFADIVDTDFTRDIYTTNDASKLTTTIATAKATYNKSSYQFHPVAATWKYITAMIYDLVLGLSIYKSSGESGSGAATGYCDATTIDTGTSGQRELLRGGTLYNAGNAGLWCLNLYDTLGNANWYFLSRPSVSALGGELPE